jgi:monolysocardiolipin acyltransferase
MFIDGHQEVMHESREWPRFIPRAGKNIKIAFGESIDGEAIFGELREKWRRLVRLQKEALMKQGEPTDWEMGELTEGLKYGPEAVELRKEVTMKVRNEVLKLRRSLGYPDEDPKQGLVETWIQEGPKQTGKMDDGSWVGDT